MAKEVASAGGTAFGEYFAELRRRYTGKSLRQFCSDHGFDPGNISKMERGKLPPPQSSEILERYASALGLEEGSDGWYEFFDRAAASRGEIPPDLLNDADLVQSLPILFRTLRGSRVSDEQLSRLAEILRKA